MANDTLPTDVIGVYAHDRVATVRDELAALGVPDDHIHVEEDRDLRASLRAEQVEEVDHAIGTAPSTVALPEEPTKAMGWTLPVAAAVGAVLGALVALIPTDAMTLGTRLFWFCLIGVAACTTIAFVVTSAMAAKDPFVAGGAQRGIVLRIEEPSRQVTDRLAALHPIRLDLVAADGTVVRTLRTEEDDEPGGALEELARNVEREREASPTDRHR